MLKSILSRCLCFLLAGALLLSLGLASAGEPDAAFSEFADTGRVLTVTEQDGELLIEAEGFGGYHADESPSVTLNVRIGAGAEIKDVSLVDMKAQTPGFDALVSEAYLKDSFIGLAADAFMLVDAVSGATLTSDAALNAVRTAAYYAAQAYGLRADTGDAELAAFEALYPAAYTAIPYEGLVDAAIGTVLYAGKGAAPDGTEVLAMKVIGKKDLDFKGAGPGFESGEPGPYTMIIIADLATHQVTAWQVVADGTNMPKFFTVPDDVIDSYKQVAITDGEVFDAFFDGLVTAMEYELEESWEYGGMVITGTSILYTGATQSGTFSSQMVRQCFKTAARFYAAQ